MIYTQGAVVLGMVYNYLPFMVIPLYSIMTKIEPYTLEAAGDLGANPWNTFTRVVLPLSVPGITYRHHHGICAVCFHLHHFPYAGRRLQYDGR